MAEVFVTNRTNVQLPATEENPGGSVVVLQPGLNEVDDEVAKDPFVAHLVESSADEVKAHKVQTEVNKKVAEAQGAALQAAQEAEKAKLEASAKAAEEHAKKKQAAIDKGVAFNEPSPDPQQAQADALTGEPAVYATAGFTRKEPGDNPAPRVRPTPDTQHGSGAHRGGAQQPAAH